MESGDFNTPCFDRERSLSLDNCHFYYKAMRFAISRVFSTLMLSTAVICHVDFANSASFHITYPAYDVRP